jgi:peptidyl-prolyl cis-trans isomerase SurA
MGTNLHTFWKHATQLLIGGLLFGAQAAVAQTVMLDRVVAIVDNDVVMESELQARTASVLERLRATYRDQLPPMDVLQTQILDQLIYERLQLEHGERYGITVSDAQLNSAVRNIMESNQMTEEQLVASLAEQGMTINDFRRQIHTEMTVNQVQQAIVNSRIRVTEQDIDSFLASTDGRFATSPDYRLGHILIAVPSSADSESLRAAEKKAEDLYQQLQDGADFSQLALTHSNDQSALQGGDLGWRKLAQLPELFGNVMGNLKTGEVSRPFRSGAGYHLLKNYEQRGGGEQLITQTKVRHILVKISAVMDEDGARNKLLELKRKIAEDGADFAKLARENSEDIGSMLNGGDLGWSTPGMFVPVFEETMKQMEVGQISDPFRSQFGWHILQVEDRRQQDMSERVIRNQAANLLRERRFDEELQTWLTDIRASAYIEINL